MSINIEKIRTAVYQIQDMISYTFTDPTRLWEALQASGSGVRFSGERRVTAEGNKRLAMLGGAWLRAVLVSEWYFSGEHISEANERLQLATNANLARVCENIGMHRCINLNTSHVGPASATMRARALEAVLGAVMLDGGVERLKEVVGKLDLGKTN